MKPARTLALVAPAPVPPVDEEAIRRERIATWLGVGIPARRAASHGRSGIKLIINHAHVAMVLRVKQAAEDAEEGK